jgi:serine protease Do
MAAPAPAPPAPLQEAGFLGLAIEDVSPETAESLGLERARGARVVEVLEDGPAAGADVREGDVVLSWNGESVEGSLHLRRLVRETPPERRVPLVLFRDGERMEAEVTVGEHSGRSVMLRALDDEKREEIEVRLEEARERVEEARERAREGRERAVEIRRRAARMAHRPSPRIGVRLSSLTDQLGGYFGIEGDDGALVVRVDENSPADSSGLRAGDVIVSVDGEGVEGPGDVAHRLRRAAGRSVEMELIRRGERQTISVTVPEGPEEAEGAEIPGMDAVRFQLRQIGPRVRAALEGIEIPFRTMELEPTLRGVLRDGRFII